MTTDQTWACPICGMSTPGAHGCVGPSTVTPLPATVGQPTPTSSLEEARKRIIKALDDAYPEVGWGTSPWITKMVGDLEAAARAEVMREVEAVAEREHAIMWARTGRAWADAVEEDADLCRGRALRALSQGGEGKA